MSGRVIYIAPDHPIPSGGMRSLYRHVEQLCAAGERAMVWHRDPGMRCDWFDHDVAIVGGDTMRVLADDLLVVPEVLVFAGFDPAPGARKAIFNQGYFNTFDHWDQPDGYPGWQPQPALWTTSEASAAVLDRVLPDLPLHRVPVSIDVELYRPAATRARRIAWMPRRRATEARLLELLWRADDRLRDVELVALDGVSERAVAEVLGSTSVFVALGEREGFGRPPAEALAAGCLVVGYPAGGGAELFEAPGAFAVPDADLLALAELAAALVLGEHTGAHTGTGTGTGTDELRHKARAWIAARYGVDRERDALLSAVRDARRRPGAPSTATHPSVHAQSLPGIGEPAGLAAARTELATSLAELAAAQAELTAARAGLAELGAAREQAVAERALLAEELATLREQSAAEVRELATQLDDATGELAGARRRAAALADELRDRSAEQAAWSAAIARLASFEETSALLAEYTRDTARLNNRLDDTIRQKMDLEVRIADLEASTSWRATAPLRRITATLKGERRG